MKKIVLTAILVAAAFGGDFEEAAKAHIKAYDTQRSMDLFEKSCSSEKNGAGCYLAAAKKRLPYMKKLASSAIWTDARP